VATLSRSDSSPQTAIDPGRARKYISRKKLKTDDETSGDCKNQGMSCDDVNDAEADAADDNDGSDHGDTKLNRYSSFVCFVCEFVNCYTCMYAVAFFVFISTMFAAVSIV